MDALDKVHDFLERPFWPEHLEVGAQYQLQADDIDTIAGDHTDDGWFTVDIVDQDTVVIETAKWLPNPNSATYERYRQPYRRTIRRQETPLVHAAMLVLALAFRLDVDEHLFDPVARRELMRCRGSRLRQLYETIAGTMPWLRTLGCEGYYLTGDALPFPEDVENCRLGAYFTPHNDLYLCLGYPMNRFRLTSGGGHKYATLAALQFLAEAIRLESEGK